ncbi:hypothetical protein B0T25DRAFT_573437 [Lasiosphaeria hispida]|uniref:Uncharacterized protein n=1 Tax=Lasiosphaeria hispida TaxID=260671 RepID=A0AAJ0MA45_9PEZI|nr:hypothetical protein B0T25DRAFT_573437 [Lasiosphaeria hispida]
MRGHEAMAGYALQNLKEGKKAFVDFTGVNENFKDFCDNVQVPSNTINWTFEKRYHKGTPDELVVRD